MGRTHHPLWMGCNKIRINPPTLSSYPLFWSHSLGGDSNEYFIHLCLSWRFLTCHSVHPNNPESISVLLSFKGPIVNRDVVYFAVCGTLPSSRKFSVDKVWGAAATVGQGGNFFVPAARVISSSLNYASAEVSSTVRVRQVQREDRGELSRKAHKTLQ